MNGMRYRTLGDDGPTVSVVGLGTNNFGRRVDLDGTRAVVDAALEVGVTLIDTADVYGDAGGSELLLGEVLRGRRDEVVLATKFGADMGGLYGADTGASGSSGYIRRAIEGSLQRLQTDRVDLYQYHFPDGVTPIEETLGALDELVREGKVRYVGSSNMTASQVEDAEHVARRTGLTRFVSAQNQFSLLERAPQAELVPTCARFGIGILPYFPLASGLLSGKYRRGEPTPAGTRLAGRPEVFTDQTFTRLEAFEAFASGQGLSMLDVAIGWLAAQPGVASVIAGATKPEQVRANTAAGAWVPTAEDLSALDRAAAG